jgi:hypothetical protein
LDHYDLELTVKANATFGDWLEKGSQEGQIVASDMDPRPKGRLKGCIK